jgi:hypothetical protein
MGPDSIRAGFAMGYGSLDRESVPAAKAEDVAALKVRDKSRTLYLAV